jgi:CDP-diacylglycerol--serine O-phosphatidyltransferase
MKNRKRRLTPQQRKRVIPNLATVFNMFLGFLAIGFIIKGDPIRAGWLLMVAAMFDVIDGKLARLIGIPSRFGTEFDSFADTISFCTVPSLLVYSLYVGGLPPILAGIFSFMPLLFGTIRLARFNIAQEENPTPYFTGLTTPLNAILIVAFLLFNHQINGHAGDPRIALVMVVILSFLMISPIRFSKFPLFSFRQGRSNSFRLVGILVASLAVLLTKGVVLFPLLSLYIIWSILKWVVYHNRFEDEPTLKSTLEDEFNE